MKNLINWFEIPASDFNRAVNFYQSILSENIEKVDMMGTLMGMLPMNGENVSGAIVKGEGYEPNTDGALIYLNGGNDLSGILSKIEPSGGKVIVPKTQISPEFGYFALFIDTEGNKLGLHSPN